jgi:hypothetical protein
MRVKSSRLVMAFAIAVAINPAATLLGDPVTPLEPTRDPESMMAVKGCVQGGSLTRVIKSDGTRDLGHPTYRLTGSRALLDVIRKEHDGHYLEVVGRLRDTRDPNAAMRRHKKIGKASVTVGAARGDGTQFDRIQQMPSIDVASFRHIGDACP